MSEEKKVLLFIHGYGSGRDSRKFADLKSFFEQEYDCHILEWQENDDILQLLDVALKRYEGLKSMVLIGDSTGANFACQLAERRSAANDVLILTSPLLDIDHRIADFPFPPQLKKQLTKFTPPKNALVIASLADEVLDQTWLLGIEIPQIFKLQMVDDSHRLMKFNLYLNDIKDHIDAFIN